MNIYEQFDIRGEVALVTGASSGLGAYFAEMLAAQGAKVICAARRLDRLEALVEQITAQGGEALAVAMDVTDPESIDTAFRQAQTAFGPLSILINNAGVSVGSLRFEEYKDKDIDFSIVTNLIGAVKVARRAIRQMIENNIQGNIVNIASMLGIANMEGSTCYDASKWGLVGFTRSLMLDMAPHRIRVNALCPGVFPTEVWADGALEGVAGQECIQRCPLGRAGELHELGGALLLLVSPAGSYINGAILPVDGGHHIQPC